MMENFVRDFLVYKKQSFLPFASNLSLKVKKGKISLAFQDDFALGLYEKSGFGSQIKDFFIKTYMLDYSVAATLDENGSGECKENISLCSTYSGRCIKTVRKNGTYRPCSRFSRPKILQADKNNGQQGQREYRRSRGIRFPYRIWCPGWIASYRDALYISSPSP